MEVICIDTNLLIDYFRKKDKSLTRLFSLAQSFKIVVPSVVAYEFFRGQNNIPLDTFLDSFFAQTTSLSFDLACARKAAEIWQHLRSSGKSIEAEDLLIAATAVAWGYPLATLNHKHYNSVPGLILI
jgi:predicted nucleic acid-binding protein